MTVDQHINVNSSIRIILSTALISVSIKDGVAGKSSLASMICTFNLHEIVKDINVYTIFVPFAKDILSRLVVTVLVHNPIYVKL